MTSTEDKPYVVRTSLEEIVRTKLCLEAQVIARMVSLSEGCEYEHVEVVEAESGGVLGYYLSGEGYRVYGDEEPMPDDAQGPLAALDWDTRGMTLAQWNKGYGEDKATENEDRYAVLQELVTRYGVEAYLPSEQDWDKRGGPSD